ncbi:MAG: hypothetical protein GX375_06075 [Clostridiales bacterium]|nr:hypothetical protein [Clostridiales bacterium]
MEGIPNLIGLRLEEGLATLENNFKSLNVVIKEYTIPDDFYKKNLSSGTKRIVRQKRSSMNQLELVVFSFNETPEPLL